MAFYSRILILLCFYCEKIYSAREMSPSQVTARGLGLPPPLLYTTAFTYGSTGPGLRATTYKLFNLRVPRAKHRRCYARDAKYFWQIFTRGPSQRWAHCLKYRRSGPWYSEIWIREICALEDFLEGRFIKEEAQETKIVRSDWLVFARKFGAWLSCWKYLILPQFIFSSILLMVNYVEVWQMKH